MTCECGCGAETNPAPYTDTAKGWVKGEPMRFLRWHRLPPIHHGPANNRFNGGLCRHPKTGRWLITGRDGSLTYFYRAVMAASLGRELRPDEIVHHRNGDPADDRIENLELTTRTRHGRLHATQRREARDAT